MSVHVRIPTAVPLVKYASTIVRHVDNHGTYVRLCPGQGEALEVSGSDVVAFLSIGADSADVGHEDARLAGDVGPGVPRFGQRIKRGVGYLVDVRHPRILRLGRRFDSLEISLSHKRKTIGNPVDVLLDGHHHVADDGWAAGPGDGEQVRKVRDGDSEIGARPVDPLLAQGASGPTLNVDVEQGASHSIEAGSEDDAVAGVL